MEADMQPEGYSHNRRDATMTPLCGSHRVDTKNSLLQKSNLGCVRTTSYDLPQDFSFTFGMANKPDGLTAHTVIDNWAEFTGTKNARPPKDFKAMNRVCCVNLPRLTPPGNSAGNHFPRFSGGTQGGAHHSEGCSRALDSARHTHACPERLDP